MRIEFKIASGTEWVHCTATVTSPETEVAAPVGWPTPTITWVSVADVKREDDAPLDGVIERIEARRIVRVLTKEDS